MKSRRRAPRELWQETFGEDTAVDLLGQTLQEEKDTDVKLSKVADKMTVEEDGQNKEEEISGTQKAKRTLGRNRV